MIGPAFAQLLKQDLILGEGQVHRGDSPLQGELPTCTQSCDKIMIVFTIQFLSLYIYCFMNNCLLLYRLLIKVTVLMLNILGIY